MFGREAEYTQTAVWLRAVRVHLRREFKAPSRCAGRRDEIEWATDEARVAAGLLQYVKEEEGLDTSNMLCVAVGAGRDVWVWRLG